MTSDQLKRLRSALESDVADEYARDPAKRPLIGSEQYKIDVRNRWRAAGVILDSDDPQPPPRNAAEQFDDDHSEAVSGVKNRYKADPGLRSKYGGKEMHREILESLKSKGLATEEDAKRFGGKKGGGLKGLLGLEGAEDVIRGIGQSAHAGAAIAGAVGAVVQGFERGVMGAATGLVHAGETALSLFLSPFGKTGQGVSRIVGALAGSILAVAGAGGSIAVAGAQVGLSLGGAIIGGAVGVVGAGIGAVIGAVVGGGVPGAIIGAGIGAQLVGGLGSALASLLSGVGGAVGQALGSIGDAFNRLGGSVGDFLGSVQNVLSDLIQTGVKFANVALDVGRTGNLSLGASAGVGSLAQILTGSPGGLNGVFSGFGNMSQFRGSLLKAFGVGGATGTDPLGDVVKSADAYAKMGSIQKQLLVQGGFGGNEGIGRLFALNQYAPGTAAYMVGAARQTQLSPREVVQDARLGAGLAVVESQLDRIKTRFLTDLMPVLSSGLALVGNLLKNNSASIVEGLKSVGEWLATELPGRIKAFVVGLLEMGKSFSLLLPQIAKFGDAVYTGFATLMNGVSGVLSRVLLAIGAAAAASPFGSTLAQPLLGAGAALGKAQMDPNATDKFFQGVAALGPKMYDAANSAEAAAKKNLPDGMSHEAFRQYFRNNERQQLNVNFQGEFTHEHQIDMDTLQTSTVTHLSRQLIHAEMDTGY